VGERHDLLKLLSQVFIKIFPCAERMPNPQSELNLSAVCDKILEQEFEEEKTETEAKKLSNAALRTSSDSHKKKLEEFDVTSNGVFANSEAKKSHLSLRITSKSSQS